MWFLSLSLSLSFYSLGFESSSHGESGGIEPPSEPNRRRRQGRPRSLNVSSAALLDSGNLVLQNSSDSPLWQSFENPTDTLVQSQNFTSAASLVSGGYSFSLLRSSGNLTLRWNDTVVYFNEGFNASFTANRTLSSPTLFLQSNGILSLADAVLGSSPVVVAYSSNYGESGNMLRFVRLDPDGNLRVYSVSSGSSAPTEEWSAVADQCEVFAFCGNMGVCSYNDTAPVCGCPSQNFLPADPADPRQGCRPRTPLQDCQANWTMLQLDNTRFLTYPPQINNEQFFVGITACRQNCLTGQSCVASTALADGSGFCYIVISDFVSGYHSAALPSTSYVKVCAEGGELFDRIVARGHYTERAAAVVTHTIVEVVQVRSYLRLILLDLDLDLNLDSNLDSDSPGYSIIFGLDTELILRKNHHLRQHLFQFFLSKGFGQILL